jgi:hypothetical protein
MTNELEHRIWIECRVNDDVGSEKAESSDFVSFQPKTIVDAAFSRHLPKW